MKLHLDIGPTAILAYRRLSYSPWHALAEFVDNSTQSLRLHAKHLAKAFKKGKAPDDRKLIVSITYDSKQRTLTVEDNAMGMDATELTNALRIAHPPDDTTGRSQYGLGLKTAACWLGDRWTITTRKLGSSIEHKVVVDIPAVSSGTAKNPASLPYTTTKFEDDNVAHYTRIKIEKLHQRFAPRTLGKIKLFLSSMYRYDIKAKELDLRWQGSSLEFQEIKDFARPRGKKTKPYRREFSFAITADDATERTVWGWYGILGDKLRGRPNAGFVVLRRGRALRAHPDQWRPILVFGEDRNDLINQRITGEINLDDFEVSHTKDWIQWQGDEEVEVETKLKAEMAEYITIARGMRVRKKSRNGPSRNHIEKALDAFKEEWRSAEFSDRVEIDEIPTAETIALTGRPLLKAIVGTKPRLTRRIGQTEFAFYIAFDASPNDPYCAYDMDSKRLRVVVNANHPHWNELDGIAGVLNFLRNCAYDAVAEWKCVQKRAEVRPLTIRFIKDGLLRLPHDMDLADGTGGNSDDDSSEDDDSED